MSAGDRQRDFRPKIYVSAAVRADILRPYKDVGGDLALLVLRALLDIGEPGSARSWAADHPPVPGRQPLPE